MMMITGFEVGTEVKWNDNDGGFATGIVKAKYYNPGDYTVNGEEIKIDIIDRSPAYAVEDTDENTIVMSHQQIFAKKMNRHT